MVTHAMSIGYFDSVNRFETKKSPSNGIHASMWVADIRPIKTSGLSTTSVRLEIVVRLYANSAYEPYEDIDANLTCALDALLGAYCGDFELGGLIRHVDIFGAYGGGLTARTGYINQDGREFRVFSVQCPLICDDLWDQAP